MRRNLFILAGIILSGASLYLVLRGVPFAEVWESIQGAQVSWIIVSFLAIIAAIWARGVRWRGLLPRPIPQRDAFLIMGITFTLNQLPLRAGEIARSALATRYDIPFVTAATTVVVERLVDVLVVVVLLAAALTQLPDASPQIVQGATLFGVAGVVGFVVLLGFAHFPKRLHQLLDIFEGLLPILKRVPLRPLLQDLLDGLATLTRWGTLWHMLLWSAISWGISLLTLYPLMLAFNVTDVDLWLATVLGVTLASLSIAIPVNIASIGLFEGAIVLAGQLVGMDSITYTALGFVYHGVSVLGYLAVGALGFAILGIRMGDVAKTPPPDAP